MADHLLHPIGRVESPLTDRVGAPKAVEEDAPAAWLVFDEQYAAGLADIAPGDEIVLVTWLHLSSRDVLEVHPRGDDANPLTGVFSTRSPDRPNPIGLHRVRVVAVTGPRLRVAHLEALDGTPILDVKSARDPVDD